MGYPIHAGGIFPPIVLRYLPYCQASRRVRAKQQPLQPTNTLEVATNLGLVNALLDAEDIPQEFLPGEGFPVFSMSLLTCHKT
jgi:hypothetical protein